MLDVSHGRREMVNPCWAISCANADSSCRKDWPVQEWLACSLYWKDVHWKDRLVLEGCTLEGPACTGRMYTGRTGLYWKDVHCTGRISLYWKDVHWKDRLVLEGCTLEGSACTERISLYWKDQLVLEGLAWQEGLACTERISLCITLLWPSWFVYHSEMILIVYWFVYHSPVTFLVCVSLSCDLSGFCITHKWHVVHQLVFHSPVNFLVCVSLWDDLCGPLACISCLLCLCITGSSPGHVTSVHQAEGVLTWTVQHTHWWVRSEQLECDASVYSPVDTDACQWIPSSHCSAWACELCSAWLDYLPSPVGWNSVSSLFLAQSQSSIQKELNQMFRYVAVFFHLW